ncbi:LacI family DNA-binding transcriptional regulator [Pararoseomonas indoligenes]|uniref:LacI family DNA-binding transcriptional regulator n=1 Tax=Roseomonas indoligenes TaxID=2820811 RepID=A0A940S9Q1_9PROT|nr:LacI family DNA-binding transcriptional regulator [Pararoseomonas indoligenes]MBP0495523.1 LacI family DNA-binding transcriptional regulator [Pararoseomonas indoligenes]
MSPTQSRMVALRDVAAAAGVHPSTASRALNPAMRYLVADPVVARVQEVASRLGYRPNAVAMSLRTGRSRLIGALVPGIANPVFAPILAGAAEVLSSAGYALMVADPGDDNGRAAEFVEQLAARGADGLLLATASLRDDPALAACRARNIPAVLVNRGSEGMSSVVSDDRGGMALAVAHLLQLGHRRIALIAGPAQLSTGLRRSEGFEEALRAQGLAPDPALQEITAAYTREAGERAAARLIARHSDVTALSCANDLLALGAYDACRRAGLRIPEDISVTGHNDMPMVDLIEPPLTTVRIPHGEMGRQAAGLLLDRIGHGGGASDVVLPSALVVRGSTAAPRPTAPGAAPAARSARRRGPARPGHPEG